MSLQSAVRAAFESLKTAHPELVVDVAIGGVEGEGLTVGEDGTTEFGPQGETGVDEGTVRVSGVTFSSKPARGETIRVGGDPATVTRAGGSGVLWVIEYRKVREVSEI